MAAQFLFSIRSLHRKRDSCLRDFSMIQPHFGETKAIKAPDILLVTDVGSHPVYLTPVATVYSSVAKSAAGM